MRAYLRMWQRIVKHLRNLFLHIKVYIVLQLQPLIILNRRYGHRFTTVRSLGIPSPLRNWDNTYIMLVKSTFLTNHSQITHYPTLPITWNWLYTLIRHIGKTYCCKCQYSSCLSDQEPLTVCSCRGGRSWLLFTQHIVNWPILCTWPLNYSCLFTDSSWKPDDPGAKTWRPRWLSSPTTDTGPPPWSSWTGPRRKLGRLIVSS